jgi:hypothetical protein
MARIEPYKISEPRIAYTIFGPVLVPGPFADDYTRLKWDFKDHRDGETARFRVAGLEAYVQDCDGDASWWQVKDIRTRAIIAEGADDSSDPDHFWFCLVAAETALRAEVDRRKTILRKTGH